MTGTRTDEDVLCEWMEPDYISLDIDKLQWWSARLTGDCTECSYYEYSPRPLDLDALREIEERLTDEQRLSYMLELSKGGPPDQGYWRLIHASATQKKAALATVVRAI